MDRFALPYEPARAAFRRDAVGAEAAGIRVETGAIPVLSRTLGDGVLTIDWAHYRGKERGSGNPFLVVYLSGTHGIEGHAGSAI